MRDIFFIFFFNDTATTEIYTLSLHDALPISARKQGAGDAVGASIEFAVGELSRAVQGRDGIGPRPRLVLEDLVGPAVGELPARSDEDRHHAFTHVTSPSPGCRPNTRVPEHTLPSSERSRRRALSRHPSSRRKGQIRQPRSCSQRQPSFGRI